MVNSQFDVVFVILLSCSPLQIYKFISDSNLISLKIYVFLQSIITKFMIQRVQTLYLLLATIISGGLSLKLSLWLDSDEVAFFAVDAFDSSLIGIMTIGVLFFLSAAITFFTIFKFKNRQLQFVLGRLTILINFILLGILVYFTQNLSGEINVSEKGIGLLIPILTVLLVVLANRAIKKDEELVKSVNRLR